MRASTLALCVAAAVTLADTAAAGDPVAGRALATRCAPCHGIDGIAKQPHVPHIAGESVIYLTKQLKSFRSGERRNEQMSLMAEPLTDQEIADLVAWYASIEITATPPE